MMEADAIQKQRPDGVPVGGIEARGSEGLVHGECHLRHFGHGSKAKSVTPSEHPNPTTKIGSNMSGAPTPKWYHWF